MSEAEIYKRLYEKAAGLVQIQNDQIFTLHREKKYLLDTVNSHIEINILLRNCENCARRVGCSLIECRDAEGAFPYWKMGVIRETF